MSLPGDARINTHHTRYLRKGVCVCAPAPGGLVGLVDALVGQLVAGRVPLLKVLVGRSSGRSSGRRRSRSGAYAVAVPGDTPPCNASRRCTRSA